MEHTWLWIRGRQKYREDWDAKASSIRDPSTFIITFAFIARSIKAIGLMCGHEDFLIINTSIQGREPTSVTSRHRPEQHTNDHVVYPPNAQLYPRSCLSMRSLNTVLIQHSHSLCRKISGHPAIAVAWSLLSAPGHPTVYREGGSVHHADETDNANENINYAGVCGACYSSVVEHGLAYVS
jgi:hypothetical protein